VFIPLLAVSFVGGILGAYLLIKTPAQTFLKVLPWLTLSATLLFAFGKKLAGQRAGIAKDATVSAIVGAGGFQFLVAIYGGYFGGGMGIVMLAMLAIMGMTDIHAMNALKTVMALVINGVAVATFIVARVVSWPQAIVMTVGAIAGGYFGAKYAQRVRAIYIRSFVILVGIGMTIYFFRKAY
jgi:hypothetical protein